MPESAGAPIGMDLDDPTNGILLPESVHLGYHSQYNNAVLDTIDAIPDGLTNSQIMDRIYDIQSRAALAFADGAIVTRNPAKTTYDEWIKVFNQ